MASLSRRQFVMGAAVLGGTLALGGCAPQNKEEGAATGDAGEGLSADIVVIGSGLAGEACARSAAQNGAKVILVDKAPFIGSTFQTSMGNVSICQVPENEDYWQFTDGETDTMDAFLTRYRAATETGKVDAPYPDYDRVQAVMQASCETISWLEEIGVDFQQSFTKDQVGTDTVKPDVSAAAAGQVGGALFVEKMQAELENLGVNIMLSTEATESHPGRRRRHRRARGRPGRKAGHHGARRRAGDGRLRRQQGILRPAGAGHQQDRLPVPGQRAQHRRRHDHGKGRGRGAVRRLLGHPERHRAVARAYRGRPAVLAPSATRPFGARPSKAATRPTSCW